MTCPLLKHQSGGFQWKFCSVPSGQAGRGYSVSPSQQRCADYLVLHMLQVKEKQKTVIPSFHLILMSLCENRNYSVVLDNHNSNHDELNEFPNPPIVASPGRAMATGIEEGNWPVPMRAIGAQNLLTMPGGVSHSGYLHKKGGSQWKIMKWPLRFVIIHKGCIYYFKSSTAAYPQGAFSLNGYNRVMRATEETTSSNVFPFKIIHVNKKHRTWYFSASCEMERKKWMMGLRKEINRYHEKTDSQGNLSDDSDTDSFYGSIERPMEIKYTAGESESGDYAEDDDDEECYLRPDDLNVSPESEDFHPTLNSSPIQPGRSSTKPFLPLPPLNQKRPSLGLVVTKEDLSSSLQDHLTPPFHAKTENSALFRCPPPNASPGWPIPPPVQLKPTFCEKEQHRRFLETPDPGVKARSNFAVDLNNHFQQTIGNRAPVPMKKGPPPVPMSKGSSAGPPPVPTSKGSSAGPPPVPTSKGSSAGPPPVPISKGSSAGPPPVPTSKGSSAGPPPVPISKGSSAGPPPVPMSKGSSTGLPPVPISKGSSAGPPPVPMSKGSSTGLPPVPISKGSSAGLPPVPSNKPILSPTPSQTERVKPKLYKPELLPKAAPVLPKPPPPAAKPKVPKHSTLLAAPLHRSSPDGQSFRSVEAEKPLPRLRSQSQPSQSQVSDDDDDDYENVQLPPSVFVNTTESNDVERLFMSTSPGSKPENGLYCIRNSSKSGKVLVVWDDSEKKVRNYRIFEKESKLFLEAETKFTCLTSVIEFYYKHTLPTHDSLHLHVPYGYKKPL
ncbi:SH3 domain-binding protein 2 isoform X2 [Heptranchias perlo]|uniref:SH3 domain-binding protein 2 isoform X2 n=1 Tax=Heptranchias perlo TaxID=212740 RepID=UPI00355AC3C3